MLFNLLPPEVALHVLKQLHYTDAQTLVTKLKHFLPDRNAEKAIKLLYARLYLGHTLITVSEENPKNFDVCIRPEMFLSLGQDPYFLANVPTKLDMVFIRNVRDYTNFQQHLADFREILESEWALKYLAKIHALTFELNGRSVTTENPTLMLALVLNTLIKLTNLGKANLDTVNVSSTDIGELFPHKWGKVLGEFTNVKVLSLADNLMRLELIVGNEPLFEKHFDWPPQLRELSLARNFIKNFTLSMVKKLPKTLQVLDLSSNVLECVGLPYNESFSLAEELPNLRMLSLYGNRHLVLVDPNLLVKAVDGLEVNIQGCNVIEAALDTFLEAAKSNNVRVVSDRAAASLHALPSTA